MVRTAEVFSKMIFWLESLVYVFVFIAYEFALVPIIFLRLIFQIIRVAPFLEAVPLVIVWLIVGVPFLAGNLFADIGRFFKVLCDYKEDDEDFKIK